MGVNSLPKTVTRQRRDSRLRFEPRPSAPESSPLTTRLPIHRCGTCYRSLLRCGTGFATGDDNGKACVAVSLRTAEGVLESGSVLGHQIANFVDVGLAERQIA